MSLHDLDSEIARRRDRASSEPLRVSIPEQSATAPPALNAILAKFKLMQEHFEEFSQSLRPEFDAMPETAPCDKHPSVILSKDFDATVSESRHRGYFAPRYSGCPECGREASEGIERRYWLRRGVPHRVIDATFKNFHTPMRQQEIVWREAMAWKASPKAFLILSGSSGTGKGHLAAACLKSGTTVIDDGIPHKVTDGLFITHADMLTDLRASYEMHTTKDVIEGWRDTPMLVIDEYGVRATGKDEEPMLYQVLAGRYDKRLKTIITTNLELPELKDSLGARLMDRICEGYTAVVCRWESFRRAQA